MQMLKTSVALVIYYKINRLLEPITKTLLERCNLLMGRNNFSHAQGVM